MTVYKLLLFSTDIQHRPYVPSNHKMVHVQSKLSGPIEFSDTFVIGPLTRKKYLFGIDFKLVEN